MQALSGRRQAVQWGRGTEAADMAGFYSACLAGKCVEGDVYSLWCGDRELWAMSEDRSGLEAEVRRIELDDRFAAKTAFQTRVCNDAPKLESGRGSSSRSAGWQPMQLQTLLRGS
jgi:hypothetical protein